MVFSTVIFLCIFLPLTVIIYYILPNTLKNYYLLLASLIFYAWGEPKYLLCMLFTIAVNYLCALKVANGNGKTWLIISLVLNISMLCFFKYTDFVMVNIRHFVPDALSFIPQVVMPIGISFYTFQGMSYTIDVYRDKSLVQKNPLKLALYISMFPQLIAGPIVRYTAVRKDIDDRKHSAALFAEGAERFIVGLFKKAVLANTIGALSDQIMNSDLSIMSAPVAWLGAIAYTLQIYYDFSGYSDMAIGLGKIFGFSFPENFDHPYVSKSISEFWRRWHISLSSWFRDYVYIPLGGSRTGNVYINLLIVFILTGIWHGAGWGFLFWGLWHGFFVLVERAIRIYKTKSAPADEGKVRNALPGVFINILKHIYTLLVVIIGWVVFNLVSLRRSFDYLKVMFGLSRPAFKAYDISYYLTGERILLIIVALILCLPVKKLIVKKEENSYTTILRRVCLILLLILCYIYVITGSYNPFIYFRF